MKGQAKQRTQRQKKNVLHHHHYLSDLFLELCCRGQHERHLVGGVSDDSEIKPQGPVDVTLLILCICISLPHGLVERPC